MMKNHEELKSREKNEQVIRTYEVLPYLLILLGAQIDLITTRIALSTGKLFELNKYANPLVGCLVFWGLISLNQWMGDSYKKDKFMIFVSRFCIVLVVCIAWFAPLWNIINILKVAL